MIDYWFSNDANLDNDLLEELATVRATGIEVHLATGQEQERAATCGRISTSGAASLDALRNGAGLLETGPGFYRSIELRTGFRTRDLFLIDDRMTNVEGAILAGAGHCGPEKTRCAS